MFLKKTFMLLLCMLMIVPAAAKSKTKVIAHRGYWKCEGSAQNSLKALERAAEIKVYGSEFDVHMTADGVLVVNHDNDINGVVIQKNNYSAIKDMKLSNGETIPTLEQYLQKAKEKGMKKVKLIFEIKNHASPEIDREVARKCMDMVKEYKLQKRTEYISFSIEVCKELVRQDSKAKVYPLDGKWTPEQLKEMGMAGMDYNYGIIAKNPTWVQECHDLGMKVNIWTVDKPEQMKQVYDWNADFITTDLPEQAQALLKEAK